MSGTDNPAVKQRRMWRLALALVLLQFCFTLTVGQLNRGKRVLFEHPGTSNAYHVDLCGGISPPNGHL